MHDRRAAVSWSNTLSRPRVFKEGLVQGSPISCLLYCAFVSDLPPAISAAEPDVTVVQFADDLTLTVASPLLAAAGPKLQRALNAVDSWATENKVTIAGEKTEGLIVTVDPNEGPAKPSAPNLTLKGTKVNFSSSVKILGVHIDSQVRFATHVKSITKKMDSRINILRSLSGSRWGSSENSLQTVYKCYIRSACLYAAPAWYPFTAKTHRDHLAIQQNRAARVIVGAPCGTNVQTTGREAGLPPLGHLAERDAATLLFNLQRRPPEHPLAQLASPSGIRPRLKAAGGFRSCWRDEAAAALSEAIGDCRPDPWPPPDSLPPPWEAEARDRLHWHLAGASASRQDDPDSRRDAAEADLEALHSAHHPDLQVWTDGSVVGGFGNGGGGAVICWHNRRQNSRAHRSAGRHANSTAAEAAGVIAGLEAVLSELQEHPPEFPLQIYIYFDSRALWDRLSGLWRRISDSDSILATRLLLALASLGHNIRTCWIPGHAGIDGNEQADGVAAEAANGPHENRPISTAAAKSRLKERANRKWKTTYETSTSPQDLHRRATNGDNISTAGMSRQESVALRQLRLGRYSRLATTKFKHGKIESPACPHCLTEEETSDHFLLSCPKWRLERAATLGPSPSIDCLQAAPEDVLNFLRRCVLIK